MSYLVLLRMWLFCELEGRSGEFVSRWAAEGLAFVSFLCGGVVILRAAPV
jgi:hypothetical protein